MQGCLTKLRILFHCLLDGGQFILPSVVCDSDYQYYGARICSSWDDIWESIIRYNAEDGRIHCPEADDYRLKIKLLMSKNQREKEEALLMSEEAQDEPSAAPPSYYRQMGNTNNAR